MRTTNFLSKQLGDNFRIDDNLRPSLSQRAAGRIVVRETVSLPKMGDRRSLTSIFGVELVSQGHGLFFLSKIPAHLRGFWTLSRKKAKTLETGSIRVCQKAVVFQTENGILGYLQNEKGFSSAELEPYGHDSR